MRKFISIILILAMALQLSSCNTVNGTKPNDNSEIIETTNTDTIIEEEKPVAEENKPIEEEINKNPIMEEKEDLELKEKINKIISKEKGLYSIGIKDLKNGTTVYLNDGKISSASVIKVFVMAAAFKQAKEGKLDLNKKLTVTESFKVGGTGTLTVGSTKTIKQLIEYMISESDNTATNMLITEIEDKKINQRKTDYDFKYINDTIAELGCKDTGLGYYVWYADFPKGVRNTTSVRDLNNFYEKLYRNAYLGKEYDGKMIKIMSTVQNTSKLPSQLPKGTIVAHKTGAITAHEHDAGIVFGPNNDFLISVLTKKASNPYKTIGQIAKTAYEHYNK